MEQLSSRTTAEPSAATVERPQARGPHVQGRSQSPSSLRSRREALLSPRVASARHQRGPASIRKTQGDQRQKLIGKKKVIRMSGHLNLLFSQLCEGRAT